jgi:preprotein translocase subunit SecY
MTDGQQQSSPDVQPVGELHAKHSIFDRLLKILPGVADPKVHLNFKKRLMWTSLILLAFLILSNISVYGVAQAQFERFGFLQLVLGASFGRLLTLGIGPIVTASIILQLLVGSKVLPWDLKSKEGKARFQGTQKLMTILFALFEAYAFVSFGVVSPEAPGLFWILVAQLAFGGFLVLLMDEVVSKWGIGSGVSLFIAAGVAQTIFVRVLNPLTPPGAAIPAGILPGFAALLGQGELSQAGILLMPLIATIIVFLLVVYIQAIRVDIPLAWASIRGFGRRWPLKFIYTSNMPVILAAALLANFNLVGSMLASRGITLLGEYDSQGAPISGLMHLLYSPSVGQTSLSLQLLMLIFLGVTFAGSFIAFMRKSPKLGKITGMSAIAGLVLSLAVTGFSIGLPTPADILQIVVYLIFFMAFCTIFSIIWVTTSGMDADSVAGQIEELGLQIPGFRRDPRIIREVLNRYIPILAVLGGLTVGGLAAFADLTNAIGSGTGILLTVMIIYNFYEIIASRYVEEMHPGMRKFFA